MALPLLLRLSGRIAQIVDEEKQSSRDNLSEVDVAMELREMCYCGAGGAEWL